MKIAAIFNVWDDWEMLKYSVANIRPVVDGVIIVGSETSNYGEVSPIPDEWRYSWVVGELVIKEPALAHPMHAETSKRNYGLSLARDQGYTHFVMLDADEFYDREQFLIEKQRFIDNPDLAGLVCGSRVYFGRPDLTTGMDTTRVPFIHKITPDLKHDFNRRYPFAWENGRDIRIDPTRAFNINAGVEWSNIIMEHYSWVRKDYAKKIRNSTARPNLERSNILRDLANAKEGYFCEFYGKPLVRVPNRFNIPCNGGSLDEILQSVAPANPENGADVR